MADRKFSPAQRTAKPLKGILKNWTAPPELRAPANNDKNDTVTTKTTEERAEQQQRQQEEVGERSVRELERETAALQRREREEWTAESRKREEETTKATAAWLSNLEQQRTGTGKDAEKPFWLNQ